MFDFSRISETISGLFGRPAIDEAAASNITTILERTGIDPAYLAALDPAHIAEILQQHGIDPHLLEGVDLAALSQGADHPEILQSRHLEPGGEVSAPTTKGSGT